MHVHARVVALQGLLTFFSVSTQGVVAEDAYWVLAPPASGNWQTAENWSTALPPRSVDSAHIDNNGTALISSGIVNVAEVFLGKTSLGNVLQTGATVTTDLLDLGPSSTYEFSAGTLTIGDHLSLGGTLDLSIGSGMLVAEDNAVIDFSNGTILGGGQATFDGGIGSTLFLPIGIDPDSLFSSFTTLGDVFNVSGSVLVVPANFTMSISSDRPDLIRVEGTLQPEGSPSSPQSLTFTQGGVEVATGGLFNMNGKHLTLRTDSSVTGGEIRNISTLVVGDVSEEHHTFTQTSGTTDVNSSLYVGRATTSNSTAHGTFNMDGGNLSIGSTFYVGYGPNSWTSFPEGTFRQTAGTTSVGSSLWIASGRSGTGSVELTGGLITVADDLSIAHNTNTSLSNIANGEGTLAIGGGAIEVANDVTVGHPNGISTGQLTQTSGNFSTDTLTVHPGSRYDLTGGAISVGSRFELNGHLTLMLEVLQLTWPTAEYLTGRMEPCWEPQQPRAIPQVRTPSRTFPRDSTHIPNSVSLIVVGWFIRPTRSL